MNKELQEEMEVLKEELAEAEQARRNNIEILSRELEKAYVSQTHAQSEIARLETENKRLKAELEQAKSDFEKCKDLLNFYRDVVANLNKHIGANDGLDSIDTLRKILVDNEDLKLLAENYRSNAEKLLDCFPTELDVRGCSIWLNELDVISVKQARAALDGESK